MTNHAKLTDTLATFFKRLALAVYGIVYVPYTARIRPVYVAVYGIVYGNAEICPLSLLLKGGSIDDMGKGRTPHHGAARSIRR